ncbi:MAG: hypothetical protein N3A38_13115, partial [Planctomycetota bacterium]|nr:hypothetical protein [Planctomycetota bacterium]
CYPSDHPGGNFIPNWALFFVLQLEEYAARSGDRALVGAFRDRVLALFRYFDRFRNSDGLLEKLEKWVFVEWSEANRFTQDVNYPTNMLYAAALDAAGRMYGIPSFRRRATAVRRAVRRQSRREIFYADNAVRKDGRLAVTDNFSEVCQCFAFYFGAADPERDAALWKILRDEFGPRRRETRAHPEVHHANAFIGNVLRLEVLSRYGLCAKVAEELIGYYLHMAERTGTLWENDDAHASCNHGFASHAACVILRDVLGLFAIDAPGRKVRLRLASVPVEWCEGRVPVGDGGFVSLSWERRGRKLRYRLTVPAGYEVGIENPDGMELEPEG